MSFGQRQIIQVAYQTYTNSSGEMESRPVFLCSDGTIWVQVYKNGIRITEEFKVDIPNSENLPAVIK